MYCSIPVCDVTQNSLFLCVIVLDQLAFSDNLVPEHLLNSSQCHRADRSLETSSVFLTPKI